MITAFLYYLFFLLEGLGFFSENEKFNLILIAFLPSIYFFEVFLRKKKIVIPKKLFYLFFIFFIFFGVSFYFSVDRINSFFNFVFYLALFFIFIIAHNEKKLITKYLRSSLILSGLIFSAGSIIFKKNPPESALQFVYPTYTNHNHLGDFLGLVIIFLLFDFFKTKRKENLYFTLFFLPFFLFSLSRTSFIGVMTILFFLFISKKKLSLIYKWILGLTLIFFIFSQKEFYQLIRLDFLYRFLYQKLGFIPRSIISGRNEYFSQAIKGFLEKPIFGWGPGNFIYPSQKYVTTNLQQVSSSLNIFLTILTEGGLFVFILFLLVFTRIVFSFLKEKKQRDENCFFLFIYLFINFFFDYTYGIKTFFLLWFFLAGIFYQEKEKIGENGFLTISNLSLLVVFIYLTSQILLSFGNYQASNIFFPWQHQGYQSLINNYLKEKKLYDAKKIVDKYLKETGFYSYETTLFLTNFYQKINDKNKALDAYRFYLNNNRFPQFDFVKNYYLLEKDLNGKRAADLAFNKIYRDLKTTFWFNEVFADEVYEFCFKENILGCRFRYFYIPKANIKEKTDKTLPYQAVYTINKDGLNERFNYSKKKSKDVFRIAVLGGAEAFGFLINTKDNWAEILEDELRLNFRKEEYKRKEVINFSYHSYDLGYQVERFTIQVKDYSPDLIIWLDNDFYRLNEIFLPITQQKEALIKINKNKEKYQKQGIYFPSWELAKEEYEKKIKELKINVEEKQMGYLQEVFLSYRGPIIFISFYDPPQEIKKALEENTCYLYLPEFLESSYQFEKTGGLNYQGQEKLAQELYQFIQNHDLSLCQRGVEN